MTITPDNSTMNKKPVFWRDAKTVLNMESGFRHKLLCDGPVFSAGDACAYGCAFCYVGAMTDKLLRLDGSPIKDMKHEDIVVRRRDAVDLLREQLTVKGKGNAPRRRKYDNDNDNRVLYMSHSVDVAANMELLYETVEACLTIMELTAWHIRLLSKSNFLHLLPGLLIERGMLVEEVRQRLIFGVSTGTLDDKLAASFEIGCAKVSKRIESLHRLQDEGFRTYGMICPSLPQADYDAWAWEMANAIRADQCEHVWAEVLNPRGSNMEKMIACLEAGGYPWEAEQMRLVTNDYAAWEEYAKRTFMAHSGTDCYGLNQGSTVKLRFLQYVTKETRTNWELFQPYGAILL